MKITMDLLTVLCYVILIGLASAKFAVKISRKAAANANIVKNDTVKTVKNKPFPVFNHLDIAAYPQPLPTDPSKYLWSPSTTIYQGLRYKNDKRVFRKRFEHEAMLKGQQIVCQGIFDCLISHIAIESSEAIPVLLRGGAGYRHFMAVIKAKPHHELRGQVRVYCRSNHIPLEDEDPKYHQNVPRRRFFFGDRLDEKKWTHE